MRLITANVNGIRAAQRRGGLSWLAEQDAEVVALQEVRASQDQLSAALADSKFADWDLAHAPSSQAGRAGVAVLAREGIDAVRIGLPGFEDVGRWVEADVHTGSGIVTVASCYVHTGEAGTERQTEKYAFLDAISERLTVLRVGDAVLTGDLNICHTSQDLKNWKGNRGKAGFLPQEQAYLDTWATAGWVDVGRRAAGNVEGPYTWWSWRGKAFDNDSGWRIDYAWESPSLAARATEVRVGRAAAYDQRWSDHAAVLVDHR